MSSALVESLRLAALLTLLFFLILCLDFPWRSAMIGGISIGVVVSLAHFLVLPRYSSHSSILDRQFIAVVSVLSGYWLIIYAIISWTLTPYASFFLFFGLLCLFLPFILLWTTTSTLARQRHLDTSQHSHDSHDSHDSDGSHSSHDSDGSNENTKERDFPRPQIISVVWYWNRINILMLILALVPPIGFALVLVAHYGISHLIEGIAIGAAFSGLGLLYIVYNH